MQKACDTTRLDQARSVSASWAPKFCSNIHNLRSSHNHQIRLIHAFGILNHLTNAVRMTISLPVPPEWISGMEFLMKHPERQ